MTATPTRSTAAVWRPGDPVGDRRFLAIGDLALERGGVLPDVTVAYETWGTLSPTGDNAVLVEHALTGDSHVVGDVGSRARVARVVARPHRPGRARSTPTGCSSSRATCSAGARARTGPSSAGPDGRPWGGRFPFITIRDQVAAEAALADALGIERWHGVLGGSMGGMRVARVGRDATPTGSSARSSWRPRHTPPPTRSRGASRSCSRSARPGATAVATTTTTSDWPVTGMGIARRIAHTTYRHEAELDDRFGRRPRPGEDPLGGGGRYDVESYLDHHAEQARPSLRPQQLRRAHRGDEQPRRRARARRASPRALRAFTGELHVAGVTTDRLYPMRLSEEHRGGAAGHGPVGHRVPPRPRRVPRRDRAGRQRSSNASLTAA